MSHNYLLACSGIKITYLKSSCLLLSSLICYIWGHSVMKLRILVSVISVVNGLLLVTVLTFGHSVSRESIQSKDGGVYDHILLYIV